MSSSTPGPSNSSAASPTSPAGYASAGASNGGAAQWSQHKFRLSTPATVSAVAATGTGAVTTSARQLTPVVHPPKSPVVASSSTAGSFLKGFVVTTPTVQPHEAQIEPATQKVKKRTSEEEVVVKQTATRFASCISADHIAALYPDVDTPFVDAVDAVSRLLPYHVFQQPHHDLDTIIRGSAIDRKGKRKATEQDELANEIAETKFALQCFKRRKSLEERFRRARTKSGSFPSPSGQAYTLAALVLESERSETTLLHSEVRAARTELDRIERDRRSAAAAQRTFYPTVLTSTASTSAPGPASASPTTASPGAASLPPGAAHFYRPYPYAYANPAYAAAMGVRGAPGAHGPMSLATGALPYAPPAAPASGAAPADRSPAPAAATRPIPVQLPISSLPALHAIGIVPVPAPAPPGAAAVLHSATQGGMLSLEINVGALQSAQMNGLAMVLNSMMRGGGAVAVGATGQAIGYALPGARTPAVGSAAPSAATTPAPSVTPATTRTSTPALSQSAASAMSPADPPPSATSTNGAFDMSSVDPALISASAPSYRPSTDQKYLAADSTHAGNGSAAEIDIDDMIDPALLMNGNENTS